MEDHLDPNVIKATQISLGKYVKRPPLSEKLLRKPPFRFLHDIVTSVLKNKGFFEGLFEETELISDNVKDRDSKISFLNKVISVVSLTTGQSLSVKSSKIVSGQEPERTNELLQCLAQALDKNLSSHEAVKQYKAGIKVALSNDKRSKESLKSVKNTVDSKKLTSKSNEKIVIERNGKSKPKEVNTKDANNKKESPPKKTSSKVSNKKLPEKAKNDVLSQQHDSAKHKNIISVKTTSSDNVTVENTKEKKSDNVLSDPQSSLTEKNSEQDINVQQDIIIQEEMSKTERGTEVQKVSEIDDSIKKPAAVDNQFKTKDKEIEIETDENMKTDDNDQIKVDMEESNKTSIRNIEDASVKEAYEGETDGNRPTAVNTYDKKDISNPSPTIVIPTIRPSSSRPGAPRLKDKSDIMSDSDNIIVGKVNIISENTLQEEEKDTSIIVENQIAEILDNQKHNDFVSTQNSHLVQQILDSQKEYSQTTGKTEIEWQFGAQKMPDVYNQEMEQLRFNVQALSRIANPLGKLLDHIQEDVEVMRQELQQWTKLYEDTSKDLLKHKTANAESLLPLHTKLKQLNLDIGEKHEKITDVKVSIHKNASRIEKLLANGNVQ